MVMDVHQQMTNSDDMSSVLGRVANQFFDQAIDVPDKKLRIQHLNDDCLLEIFSVKSLALMDLCSLAETCTRFEQITKRVFPRELWIDICNNGDCEVVSRYSSIRGNTAHQIDRILRNFGPFLTAITISSHQTSEERSAFVLNLITKHCVKSLERLRIHSTIVFKIPAVLTVQLKPIFKRLQLLELRNVVIVEDKKLFSGFDSLIELRVIFVQNCGAIIENVFPKLERFTFQGRYVKICQPLPTFVSRHPSLKRLELHLHIRINEKCKDSILQVIGNRCSELKKLTLNIGCANASSLLPLQALKSLERLKLWNVNCDDLSFILPLTKLRELHLTNCVLPKDSDSFASLTQLTQLHINLDNESGTVDVVAIIRRLINLEELSVDHRWTDRFLLDEKSFSEIVNVVKGRPHVLELKCRFGSFYNSKNCDENLKVRLMRR